MLGRKSLSEISIPHLLKLAGVSPSDKKAAAWLSEAIEAARHNYSAAKQRPLAADHNALLADIEASAKKLIKGIDAAPTSPGLLRARSGVLPFSGQSISTGSSSANSCPR